MHHRPLQVTSKLYVSCSGDQELTANGPTSHVSDCQSWWCVVPHKFLLVHHITDNHRYITDVSHACENLSASLSLLDSVLEPSQPLLSPGFDILLLSEEMERFCSLHLGRLPENILEISSESTRPLFCDVLQVLAPWLYMHHFGC